VFAAASAGFLQDRETLPRTPAGSAIHHSPQSPLTIGAFGDSWEIP